MAEHSRGGNHQNHNMHYKNLAAMTVLSFVVMYVLMYSMVNSTENIFANLNEAYMAGLMAFPMLIIELIVMRKMYMNKKLNAVLLAGGTVATGLCLYLIQIQAGISDQQFLRSMIPHHAGAVLMCEQSKSKDERIQELCKTIISSQQDEIRKMKEWLK